MTRYKPMPPPPPGPIEVARTELAGFLAQHPEAVPTIRAVLRTLDQVREAIRRRTTTGPSPEALGCSRGATIVSEAALAAWPGFRELP